MKDRRTDEILSAYIEALFGHPEEFLQTNLTDDEQDELAPLFTLAEQLQQSLPPVQPPAAFAHSLGKELAGSARHQIAAARRMRRSVLIGAATVGSLLSIASVIGVIVYIISRLRAGTRPSPLDSA
jgi:hypothetical protein